MLHASKKLPRSFYLRPTLRIARDLLGKVLVHRAGKTTTSGRIVECEAYLGEKDPASHAFRGKTKRNEVMFLRGGHLYVYFTYGMHYCGNVVTEREGLGRAVLIRALEPIDGLEIMCRRRRLSGKSGKTEKLTSGPAKLCEALGITGHHNGSDLLGKEVYILDAPKVAARSIRSSRRIGIKQGVGKPWRFYVRGNPFVSK